MKKVVVAMKKMMTVVLALVFSFPLFASDFPSYVLLHHDLRSVFRPLLNVQEIAKNSLDPVFILPDRDAKGFLKGFYLLKMQAAWHYSSIEAKRTSFTEFHEKRLYKIRAEIPEVGSTHYLSLMLLNGKDSKRWDTVIFDVDGNQAKPPQWPEIYLAPKQVQKVPIVAVLPRFRKAIHEAIELQLSFLRSRVSRQIASDGKDEYHQFHQANLAMDIQSLRASLASAYQEGAAQISNEAFRKLVQKTNDKLVHLERDLTGSIQNPAKLVPDAQRTESMWER